MKPSSNCTKLKIAATVAVASIATVSFGSVAFGAACSGYDVLVAQTAEMTELGNGHSILTVRQQSVVITDDPNNIYNLTTGECAGSILFLPDGTTDASGHCARKDQDGDTYSLTWAQEPGKPNGIWASLGGTGKFEGRSANGTFTPQVEDGTMSASTWQGECN